jgi:hypothetical protein
MSEVNLERFSTLGGIDCLRLNLKSKAQKMAPQKFDFPVVDAWANPTGVSYFAFNSQLLYGE